MLYYRVIDGKIEGDPIEVDGTAVIEMADHTTDGRPQHLLAQATIDGVKAVSEVDEKTALSALAVVDNRAVDTKLESK